MREFSSVEKVIIQKILSNPETGFRELFSPSFLSAKVEINSDGKLEVRSADSEHWKEIIRELSMVVNLIAYLLNNKLIYAYSTSAYPPIYSATLGNYTGNAKAIITLPYNGKLLSRVTLRHLNNLFDSYQPLRDLANNKFISKEDRKHKQNVIATWTAIGVAFLASLGTIIDKRLTDNDNFKEQIKSYDKLENRINANEKKINSFEKEKLKDLTQSKDSDSNQISK